MMDLGSWMITGMMMLASIQTFFMLSDARSTRNASFDDNYQVTWGNNHVLFLNQNREVQLSLDESSGAGFASKSYYGSGYFQMKIKLPAAKDSIGVVTAFYLFLNTTTTHDELDFEFLGNTTGKPIHLQTNVFVNGVGGRERTILLWFDPTADFHYYQFLWNAHQIVFFVDNVPIRVFKNNINRGVGYLNKPMQVMVSLWDGSYWATQGLRPTANYSNAPFKAYFQDFSIDGCLSSLTNPNKNCFSHNYWWNTKSHFILNPQQQKAYANVKRKYMTYDYCTDKIRYPIPPPECLR